MNKPKEILELEKIYSLQLHQLPPGEDLELIEFKNHYEIDEENNVIGLNLSENKILDIKGLESLTYLSRLILYGNEISEIKGLDKAYQLSYLDISRNKILEIKGLESLYYLSHLNLSGNYITKIKNLDNLSWLSFLSLSMNEIDKIEGLDKLSSLTLFDISGNKINEISNLGNLTKLIELSIWGNQITEIKGLNSLINLRGLILADNKIIEIKGLEKLSQLNRLYLYNNQITEIKNLEKLKNLQSLDLDNNQIDKIRNIDKLKNLKNIDLSNNRINNIYFLRHFTKKNNFLYEKKFVIDNNEINLFGNPLDDFLIKILQIVDINERRKQLNNYFENLKQEQRPLRETKLMILGEGEAGKTNLRNYILEQPFKIGKSATTGIKIDIWNQKIEGFDYRINIWDFGGQWIQQQVHQFFITNESIYVVLLNARQDRMKNQKNG